MKKKSDISKILIYVTFPFSSIGLYGSSMKNETASAAIKFEENKNQLPAQVEYRAGVGSGTTLFMEKNKFTYVKYDPAQLEKIHDEAHQKKNGSGEKEGIVNLHAFEMIFVGSNPDVQVSASGKLDYYNNYFIGNDPSKWASEVGLFTSVKYTGIYPGIDLSAYEQDRQFKYDFNVAVGANPQQIQMHFNGADKLSIENNRLIIKTSTGDIIENVPYTFQLVNGVKQEVRCNYILSADGKTVSFEFPSGYNKEFPLIIDPVLVGATFSGAPQSCTTYGHCATYDPAGNIYTGGECFNPGYPTGVGAFQTTFAGVQDIAISKLNPDASNLIWATYLGGSNVDLPNSLFVPSNGEIYILGVTNSNNFPTSTGCFDNSYNGADDITITHLNITGTALVGSTYVGGSGNDGQETYYVPWQMNDHDAMRGEIIVDGSGNAWVACFTSSSNFPTTAGAYDQTLNGTWDGCAFRLSPNLSALQWSTYLGGTQNDCSYGLRLNSAGELYVTGCTGSNDFPSTAGVYDLTFNGGTTDAYLTRFNSSGTAILSSTFLGTSSSEISYFMDMDAAGNPYIYGSTTGTMPVTAGVYINPGSGNFVSKFNTGLTALLFSTVFGDGTSSYLEPEAFMVDICENIYMSGFGSTAAYPITANALYSTQVGTCYFICLSKDAQTNLFSSFYYGNHVDGGTSRFDPSGAIYQGICICGDLTTTPAWAWKDNTNAPFCDMFVVKIAFQQAGVNAIASAAPNDTICTGNSVTFVNTSNGVNYIWNFGDGSALDNNTNPLHSYTANGTYSVSLIAIDSNSCVISDTAFLIITVIPPPVASIGPDQTICPGFSTSLCGSGGTTYSWQPGGSITSCVTVSPSSQTVYTLTVSNAGGCTATATTTVFFKTPPNVQATSGTNCQNSSSGNCATLTASGASTYTWSPCTSPCTGSSVVSCASTNTTYTVTGTDAAGCTNTAVATVSISSGPNIAAMSPSTICIGQSTTVLSAVASTAVSYTWTPAAGLSCTNCQNPVANPSYSNTYTVFVTDASGCINSASVPVMAGVPPVVTVSPPVTICVDDTASLTSNPQGPSIQQPYSYLWTPSLTPPVNPSYTVQNVYVNPNASTTFSLIVTDAWGCKDTASTFVGVIQKVSVSITSQPDTICFGEEITLCANISAATSYSWYPGGATTTCISVVPTSTAYYAVTATNQDICFDSDSVEIAVGVAPVVTASSMPPDICVGDSVYLSCNFPAGSPLQPYTYNWQPPSALPLFPSSTVQNPVAIPITSTTYSVIVTNAWGCKDTAATSVGVFQKVYANINIPAGPDTVCAGEQITLSATVSGAVVTGYSWSPGGATTTTLIIVPTNSTYYIITATNQDICFDSDTVQVTVGQIPQLTVTSGDPTICLGDSVQLFTNLTNVPPSQLPVHYSWFPSNSPPLSSPDSANPWIIPLTTTNLIVTVTDAFGCRGTGYTTVYVLTVPSVSLDVPMPYITCEGFVVPFSAEVSNNGTQAYWQFGDGSTFTDPQPLPGVSWNSTPAHVYDFNGAYIISVTAINSICRDSADTSFAVSDMSQYLNMSPANVFTPNGDGSNDCFRPSLEMANIPNAGTPASLREKLAQCVVMEVWDRWGIKMFESTDTEKCWDGTTKNTGKPAKAGTYYYIAAFRDVTIKGFVELMR